MKDDELVREGAEIRGKGLTVTIGNILYAGHAVVVASIEGQTLLLDPTTKRVGPYSNFSIKEMPFIPVLTAVSKNQVKVLILNETYWDWFADGLVQANTAQTEAAILNGSKELEPKYQRLRDILREMTNGISEEEYRKLEEERFRIVNEINQLSQQRSEEIRKLLRRA